MNQLELVTNTKEAPFNKICHLSIYRKRILRKNKTFNSTGFFIGKNLMLTAAHNVKSQKGTRVESIRIQIGQYEGEQLFPTIKLLGKKLCASITFVPQEYGLTQKWTKKRLNDYALVYIPDEYLPKNFSWNNEFQINEEPINADDIKMAGYPLNSKRKMNGKKMYFQFGKIKLKAKKYYTHKFDTEGGNSGSPVWQEINGKRHIVGIHTFEASGTRLHDDAIRNINKWIQQTKEL